MWVAGRAPGQKKTMKKLEEYGRNSNRIQNITGLQRLMMFQRPFFIQGFQVDFTATQPLHGGKAGSTRNPGTP